MWEKWGEASQVQPVSERDTEWVMGGVGGGMRANNIPALIPYNDNNNDDKDNDK